MRRIINRNEKGITLIALVITIIVLLILAGVAIAMLSGENGILNKAVTAKIETEKASAEEEIKLAAMAALVEGNGKIQGEEAFNTLENELKDAGYDVGEITKLPITVTVKDKEYKIDANGTVKETVTIANLIKSGKTVTEEKLTLEDEKGYKITIPKNFNISSESPELVTEGMIIEDSEDNQYVWIPVFTKEKEPEWGADFSEVAIKTEDSVEYYDAIKNALINTTNGYTKTYVNSNYTDVWYGDTNRGQYGYYDENDTEKENLIYYTNGNMTKEKYNELYNNMLKSIYQNRGFYIGRYEMGIEVVNSVTEAQAVSRTIASKEYASTDDNSTNQKPTIEGMKVPVSKANAVGYNYITQSQAQMLAKKLGEKSDYSNIESSIMFGVQWNAICVFLEHYGKVHSSAINNAGQNFTVSYLTSSDYSKYWCNYYGSDFKLDRGYYTAASSSSTVTWNEQGTTEKWTKKWLCTTGAVDQNSSLNIYDLGGNLDEWTLERSKVTTYPGVGRGYSFDYLGYASYRRNMLTCYGGNEYSSRVSLYIK